MPAQVTEPERPRVVIAGASGFVGRALIEALYRRYEIIGLTRDPSVAATRLSGDIDMTWRSCDLFSLLDLEQALDGARYAIYLVHSMMPSARLTQGSFEDFDLLLADNFARAADACGVEQIVYLGGIIPDDDNLSAHLRSRLEVEHVLGARAPALTALRAGLVVGRRGSSFRILERLVDRLPLMLCPSWTRSRTHPIALGDVVAIIDHALGDEGAYGVISDVGGPDVMTYLEMIEQTARAMGRSPRLVPVPFLSPGLSRLWVSALTGVPRELVSPLVESLRHPMVAHTCTLQERYGIEGLSFSDALQRSIGREGTLPALPDASTNEAQPRPQGVQGHGRRTEDAAAAAAEGAAGPAARSQGALTRREARSVKFVTSVQRLPRPAGWCSQRVAQRYAAWLPGAMRPFLCVEDSDSGALHFRVRGTEARLLTLQLADERSGADRTLYYITGGMLADTSRSLRGRLEFRTFFDHPNCVIAAIHDFSPRLPWYLYNLSQACVHLWVMRRFSRHLRDVREAGAA